MALVIYTDSGTTTEALPNEVYPPGSGVNYCDGSNKVFNLGFIAGVELVSSVYVETQQTSTDLAGLASVSFTDGVSSAIVGATYTNDELIGKRIIHNGEFRGIVTDNTSTTITIDDLNYTGASSSVKICTFTKQRLTLDYTKSGTTITFVNAPSATSYVHVVPTSTAGLAFGGTPGQSITKTGSVWIKREPGYEYHDIKVYSQDNSVADNSATAASATSTGDPGVVSGFSGLTTNALVGYALWHNGAFRGIVTENNATTVTLDRAYTEASASEAVAFNIGPMLLSLDNVTFEPVVTPSDITTDTAVRIYYKDTITIPNAPINYPNIIIKVTGTEYIGA